MPAVFIQLCYLLASTLFIFGIKGLAHPRTAARGNLFGALGMLVAVVATFLNRSLVSYSLIFAGMLLGSAIGVPLALKVSMTAMPQMVALLNGFGGGSSVLVAGSALIERIAGGGVTAGEFGLATAASGIVGAVTFWGSLVAFGKLQGVVAERSLSFPGLQALNALFGLLSLGFAFWLVAKPTAAAPYWLLVTAASLLGVTSVLPIGGADMPVVIALLNSYSGIAAAATGFVLSNDVLIIAGSLVGASGIILSQIMCKAMNRSLTSVLFGLTETVSEGADKSTEVYAGKIKSTTAEEVAMLLETAGRVVVVPGYGLAVAQAQHAVRDLANVLESKGAVVEYGIHPVAGRMPGHMNILLAEANVPYEKLKAMDEINATFVETDVVLVIGANDVVNPLARADGASPIAGMPILDVDKARTVVVIKRSLSPGFAGVPNPLFAADNTLMLFGDGKEALLDLIAALKEG